MNFDAFRLLFSSPVFTSNDRQAPTLIGPGVGVSLGQGVQPTTSRPSPCPSPSWGTNLGQGLLLIGQKQVSGERGKAREPTATPKHSVELVVGYTFYTFDPTMPLDSSLTCSSSPWSQTACLCLQLGQFFDTYSFSCRVGMHRANYPSGATHFVLRIIRQRRLTVITLDIGAPGLRINVTSY